VARDAKPQLQASVSSSGSKVLPVRSGIMPISAPTAAFVRLRVSGHSKELQGNLVAPRRCIFIATVATTNRIDWATKGLVLSAELSLISEQETHLSDVRGCLLNDL
jgi:hypothetical protein